MTSLQAAMMSAWLLRVDAVFAHCHCMCPLSMAIDQGRWARISAVVSLGMVLSSALFSKACRSVVDGMSRYTSVHSMHILRQTTWQQRYEWVHVALILGFAMRCRYSNSLPFLPRIEFAISQSQIIGYLQVANFAIVISNVGLVISMHASIASCMMFNVHNWVLHPRRGSSLSSCKM